MPFLHFGRPRRRAPFEPAYWKGSKGPKKRGHGSPGFLAKCPAGDRSPVLRSAPNRGTLFKVAEYTDFPPRCKGGVGTGGEARLGRRRGLVPPVNSPASPRGPAAENRPPVMARLDRAIHGNPPQRLNMSPVDAPLKAGHDGQRKAPLQSPPFVMLGLDPSIHWKGA